MNNTASPSRQFDLGRVTIIRHALERITIEQLGTALGRHGRGDWGDVTEEDKDENDYNMLAGYRLHSVYQTLGAPPIWIITEADRSLTTVLFPEDYMMTTEEIARTKKTTDTMNPNCESTFRAGHCPAPRSQAADDSGDADSESKPYLVWVKARIEETRSAGCLELLDSGEVCVGGFETFEEAASLGKMICLANTEQEGLLSIRQSIDHLLDSLWASELHDFEVHAALAQEDPDSSGLEGHVFQEIVTLNNWLSGKAKSAEDYLPNDLDPRMRRPAKKTR